MYLLRYFSLNFRNNKNQTKKILKSKNTELSSIGEKLTDKTIPENDKKALNGQLSELKDMKRTMLNRSKEDLPIAKEVVKILESKGFKIIKIPGGVLKNDKRNANFMNAVPGTDEKTGQKYLITNHSSIPSLREAFEEFIKKSADISNVFFIGDNVSGKDNTSGGEKSLGEMGGIDCRTNEFTE